jgi:Ser-tRNA(Ala) deacylase AlaX
MVAGSTVRLEKPLISSVFIRASNPVGNVRIPAALFFRSSDSSSIPPYYDLRGKIVKAERRITTLTERGEMWKQYNQYKSIHKQFAKVKPEKREQFEQRHSRELILYDAAARYLKELKDSGEAITPKAWQLEIDQLAAGKQTDTLAMKAMREDLKAVERLRKTAEQLSRQELDKPHDREPER